MPGSQTATSGAGILVASGPLQLGPCATPATDNCLRTTNTGSFVVVGTIVGLLQGDVPTVRIPVVPTVNATPEAVGAIARFVRGLREARGDGGAGLALEDHREILAAMRSGDAEAAVAAIRTHLGRIEDILARVRVTHGQHFRSDG